MKPPVCKVCQRAHWTYDGHSVSDVQVPEYVKEMARGALGKAPQAAGRYGPPVTESIRTRTRTTRTSHPAKRPCRMCLGPIEGKATYCSQACQKRAYRERSK